MKDQINTIREALDRATRYTMLEPDAQAVQQALTALDQLEAMVGSQEPVAWCPALTYPGHEKDRAWANGKPRKEDIEYWTLNGKGITYAYAAPVAQQPQEIEVQCPVCNHKFYEWPNDKQPQAEAVPVVDRVYEAAKRLVDHADFQLGGVLSAKSKARDIPSNAASKVKARHLASLRDALAKTPQQAEAVPSDVARDAERYRKLRTFHWSESSMCVVLDPKKSVLLGAVCPSGTNLDDYIDAAIAQQKGQP